MAYIHGHVKELTGLTGRQDVAHQLQGLALQS